MNPASQDMKDALVSAGIGTFGTDLFVSMMPDSPDLCISLHDTGTWREPEPTTDLEYPTIQAMVRGGPNQYLRSRALMESVYTTIRDLDPQTINSTWYGGFWVVSGPMSLGQDERQRPIFSTNFRLMRSE